MNSTHDTHLTVCLPDIGEGVVEGEVIAWLKLVGDEVAQDEPIVVVMTDKATVELPAPKPGRLAKQYVAIGEMAIKNKPLYDIELEHPIPKNPATLPEKPIQQIKEELPVVVPESIPEVIPEKREEPQVASVVSACTSTCTKEKAQASPATRYAARELEIDINEISGTGPAGRVLKVDLPRSRIPRTPIPRFEGDEEVPMKGIKQLMSDRMTESMRIVPHFSFFEQADVSRLVLLKEKIAAEAEKEGIKLTYMPFFIRAMSKCITKFPLFNSSLDEDKKMMVLHKPHHIGVAMAAPYGLIVPIIKNVERLSLKELIKTYDDLKVRAFSNRLQSSEMKGGTVTLTNFGALPGASLGGTPIINYPEAAICGVARIQKMAKVVNNELAIRDLMNVSFSFDHRLIDGQLASQISSEFCRLLENPAQLI